MPGDNAWFVHLPMYSDQPDSLFIGCLAEFDECQGEVVVGGEGGHRWRQLRGNQCPDSADVAPEFRKKKPWLVSGKCKNKHFCSWLIEKSKQWHEFREQWELFESGFEKVPLSCVYEWCCTPSVHRLNVSALSTALRREITESLNLSGQCAHHLPLRFTSDSLRQLITKNERSRSQIDTRPLIVGAGEVCNAEQTLIQDNSKKLKHKNTEKNKIYFCKVATVVYYFCKFYEKLWW